MAEKMKRNVSFAKQEEQGDGIGDAGLPETKRIKTFKEKHSLDSDEEDKVDETATYRMNEEEIEGEQDLKLYFFCLLTYFQPLGDITVLW